MNDIALFYLLKQKILVKYREHFPYYSGDIHKFGNKEIAQLIDLIEKECNERVSEKWVYTHLKPIANDKLPRKDMLNILCRWTGFTDWDEFAFNNKNIPEAPKEVLPKNKNNNKNIVYAGMGIAAVLLAAIIGLTSVKGDTFICFKDKYTKKEIEGDKVIVNILKKSGKEKLPRKGNCFLLKDMDTETVLIVESAYYKPDTLHIAAGSSRGNYEFDLQPDDYAMMMRAYLNNNAEDWKKRKSQLNDIISDDAVIEEIMFDDIGVEFLDKAEFISKMTTPSKISKAMEIVEIEYKENKIVSLKYMQKEK
ncbi:hypothetical protein HYN59_00980 [Flavobacterium album]|uniref:Uncharacterized protein n=1 Tax=Flavobacterium album TaxID=2175091 RepID=A0A2S1QTN3_9FLAO|nr:hypothetical protein [Flavobacterium album]AWH83772.1 hypothetical protein HYN59_00980 [Flavobacterium album]